MGFPRGKTDLVREMCNNQDFVDEWRNLTSPSNPRKIAATQVKEAMISAKDGGTWLKRHFLMLIMCCIVENSATGYISQKLLGNFEDLSKVGDLNWCKFTIQSLVEQKIRWKSNTSNPFLGPILFLVGLYVDRVVLGLRSVTRAFPTLYSWDHRLLRKRQKAEIECGRFGTGFPSDRFTPPSGEVYASTSHDVERAKSHARKLLASVQLMSKSVIDFLDVLQETPSIMFRNENLQKVVEKTNSVFGTSLALKQPPLTLNADPSTQSSDVYDYIWDRECIDTLTQFDVILMKKKDINTHMADANPSFSLDLESSRMEMGDDERIRLSISSPIMLKKGPQLMLPVSSLHKLASSYALASN